MKVVGGVGGDVGGQTRNQIPVLNRIARCRRRRAQRISGEEAPNINLGIRSKLDFVITLAGHEMVLGTEIVVDTPHSEVALDGQIQIARKSQDISSVAQASGCKWRSTGLILVPYLRNQRVETKAKGVTVAAGG